MADESGTQKGLIAVVLVLIVALVVVVVLWQRDQESRDLRIDFDTGDAGAVVEPDPPLVAARQPTPPPVTGGQPSASLRRITRRTGPYT